MYIGDSLPRETPPPPDTLPFELKIESDFDQIVSPDGLVSICGFGSLLSERSARSTFPDLLNFRVAKLRGFRRVFAHVAPIFFERGIAKPETKEISSLSVEPCEGETLVVTTFEIQRSEVTPETFNGLLYTTPSEAKRSSFNGTDNMAFTKFGWMISYPVDFICAIGDVLAAKNLSDTAYDNFLDHTFLGDRKRPSVST
ncbi:hypothetical protein DH2020_020061 [Rehmannia glutinosa]|uniref:Gamma-glutamylcyclotransferase AIG2-like domain-containing protein n=1 Tax=Rehmannia glutinosa TaxID=99300 RepID=A0ABR0WF60_REHGL